MIQPPQLDPEAPWKQRYRAAAIYSSQIAPQAPERGLVAHNQSGSLQWYAWERPTNTLRPLTDTPGGHSSYLHLAPDGRWLYFLQDEQGNEIGHYARLSFEGGAPEDITPALPPYSSFGFTLSRAGNRLAFMAAYEQRFHIYVMDVAENGTLGDARLLYKSPYLLQGPYLSQDGTLAVIMTTEHGSGEEFSLVALDVESGREIATLQEEGDHSLEAMVTATLPGDSRLLATTTRSGIERLLIWEPRTQTRTDLPMPGITGAVRAFDWSPDGEHILFRTFTQARQRLYRHHLPSGQSIPLEYPAGIISQPYFSPDGQEIFAHWQSATQPMRLIVLDAQTGAMKRTVLAAGEVPVGRPWRSVTFPSSDGQLVQGWLATPEGEGPFPTILEMPGGPKGVQSDSFSPSAQAWLDHGFAYLVINYRGCTSFGREFEQKIVGQLGHWEVEDMKAATRWLIGQGIAQQGAILLTGWSYGGYLTLMGLSKEPDLWAGGMAGIAIADWRVQYEDSADTLRGFQVALFGGTPDEKPEQYRLSSPIHYAEQVRAPILIIQGRYDTRTPARPIELYEQRMRELGKSIEVHWFDSGHGGGSLSAEEGIKHQERLLRFAHRVLHDNQPL